MTPDRPVQHAYVTLNLGGEVRKFQVPLWFDPNMFPHLSWDLELAGLRRKIAGLYEFMTGEKPTVVFDFEQEIREKRT